MIWNLVQKNLRLNWYESEAGKLELKALNCVLVWVYPLKKLVPVVFVLE